MVERMDVNELPPRRCQACWNFDAFCTCEHGRTPATDGLRTLLSQNETETVTAQSAEDRPTTGRSDHPS